MMLSIRTRQMLVIFGYLIFCLGIKLANAGEVKIAVASNFLQPMKNIAKLYEQETGYQVKVSSGSTGKLYAQISHGAPYDIFFAANTREPLKLVEKGLAVEDSRFTYAIGQVVIWSKALQCETTADLKKLFDEKAVKTIALANPKTAPYGFAAKEIMSNLNISMKGIRVIKGENINQAWQYTQTGNVDVGFIAASQWEAGSTRARRGLAFKPSQHLYTEIEQQAVILTSSRNSTIAQDFVDFIQSDDIRNTIAGFGYTHANIAMLRKMM